MNWHSVASGGNMRIGIDFGGTKIEAIALGEEGKSPLSLFSARARSR